MTHKKLKPVKAWAVADEFGVLDVSTMDARPNHVCYLAVYLTPELARLSPARLEYPRNNRPSVIPVIITPIQHKPKTKKK